MSAPQPPPPPDTDPLKTVLYFQRRPCATPPNPHADFRSLMFGRYGGAGFMFVFKTRTELYSTCSGCVFTKQVLPHTSALTHTPNTSDLDSLILSVTPDEARKIHASCVACAACRKPFNLKDLLLIHTHHVLLIDPPAEIPLYTAVTLNNAQAIILILKECLDPATNPLMDPSKSRLPTLHSRRTYVETIYDAVRPFAAPVVARTVPEA